jgi:hypothetical protein
MARFFGKDPTDNRSTVKLSPVVADSNTTRLNHFAGRYLSEQEFDQMQDYVLERCEDLLRASLPGIVEGLQVQADNNDGELSILVRPGTAVTGAGTAVSLAVPIHLDWAELISAYQRRITPTDQVPPPTPDPVNGFYFLTVKRQIERLDDSSDADPCCRFDPDPLRDSRLETIAALDLQFISDIPSWMSAGQRQVTSRVLRRAISESPFIADNAAVPLALMRIDNDQLSWIDTRAGRFLSEPNPVENNMLNWWQRVVRTVTLPPDNSQSLTELTGCDYMPAAGPFPDVLISNLAGAEIEQQGDQAGLWSRPILHFDPYDLQVELLPVPENAVEGTLATELARGVVDLVNYERDRIRLMVAVEPDDYRADLLDLPSVDMDLLIEAQQRYAEAASDYNQWAEQYFHIYGNLDSHFDKNSNNALDSDELDDLKALLKTMYVVQGPEQSLSLLDNDQFETFNLRARLPRPQAIVEHLAELAEQRRQPDQSLPRPYSRYGAIAGKLPAVDIDPGFPDADVDGLYTRREQLRERIDTIEKLIEKSSDLLDETKDFIVQQRHQLDNITTSFSILAGGVPGDGSGLSLIRRAGSLTYQLPEPPAPDDV